ncbi:hypothetical protein GLS_c06510 [Gluconobacter oxydans DSM 3504]|uniref:Uncharacterized protein n=1 Tax=Gluconobacter oxydans DSM 3504 TaxID=1288313 RepID=A0A067Z4P3_GLUOY|nr:hypothetical protein GLS_c06510 [Gluconobacter oxydans DSM 3504]
MNGQRRPHPFRRPNRRRTTGQHSKTRSSHLPARQSRTPRNGKGMKCHPRLIPRSARRVNGRKRDAHPRPRLPPFTNSLMSRR